MFNKVKNSMKLNKLVKEDQRIRKALDEMFKHYHDVELEDLAKDYPHAYNALAKLADDLFQVSSDMYECFIEQQNYFCAEAEQVNLREIEKTIYDIKRAGMVA